MKTMIKSKLAASTALTVLLLAGSPVTVFAEHGPGDVDTTTPKTTTTTHSETEHTTASTTGSGTESDGSGKSDTGGGTTLRSRAEQLLQQDRTGHQQHSEAERQKACTNHQTIIDDRFATLGTKATKFLDSYNAIFTKVQAYQTKHNLTVANYDALVADATAKQATATTAVQALSALAGTKIDCTVTDPATQVATVKTAADDARTALQAYRASLKALVQALLDASKAATTTSTGSN